jgi:hypothetical protein
MYVVDAALGRRFTLVVDQMAQVVQQRSGNERRIGAGVLGRMRGLQRVLELPWSIARMTASDGTCKVYQPRTRSCRGS